MEVSREYLRSVPQSANRPQLWAGMEFKYLAVVSYLCGMVALGRTLKSVGCAIVLFLVLSFIGRMFAKQDPHMFAIALRQFQCGRYLQTARVEYPQMGRIRRNGHSRPRA